MSASSSALVEILKKYGAEAHIAFNTIYNDHKGSQCTKPDPLTKKVLKEFEHPSFQLIRIKYGINIAVTYFRFFSFSGYHEDEAYDVFLKRYMGQYKSLKEFKDMHYCSLNDDEFKEYCFDNIYYWKLDNKLYIYE